MVIDTHCHLNFNAFKKDADKVIQQSLADGVLMINVGSQLETSQKAVALAEKYPKGVFAAVGLHPIHITGHLMKKGLDAAELAAQERIKEFDVKDYQELAKSKKVVAIGEIGLDYYYKPKTKTRLAEFKELQKQALLNQVSLAQNLGLPVIFHCRSAHEDLIKILKTRPRLKGVIHCFTGSSEQMKEYLDMGLCLGFTGIIFKQILGIDWPEIIKTAPLDRILAETDAPYLIPLKISINQSNQHESAPGRNEPVFVKEVIKEIARIRKLSYEEIAETTTRNAKALFNI